MNFGGAEGPWDHSKRLEKLGGVEVVAICDPDLPRARRVLEKKLAGEHADLYKSCHVVANYRDVLEAIKLDVAFIGELPRLGRKAWLYLERWVWSFCSVPLQSKTYTFDPFLS